MRGLTILPGYVTWHYTRAFGDIVRVWGNFIWFTAHFFSLRVLLRTLFSPWRRMVETRKRGFDIEDIIGTVVVNLLSRLVGLVVRLPIIVLGCGALSCVVLGGIVLLVVWSVVPLLPLVLILYGSVLVI